MNDISMDTKTDQTPRYSDPCSELREEIKQLHNTIDEKDQEIGAQRSIINHLQKRIDDDTFDGVIDRAVEYGGK